MNHAKGVRGKLEFSFVSMASNQGAVIERVEIIRNEFMVPDIERCVIEGLTGKKSVFAFAGEVNSTPLSARVTLYFSPE